MKNTIKLFFLSCMLILSSAVSAVVFVNPDDDVGGYVDFLENPIVEINTDTSTDESLANLWRMFLPETVDMNASKNMSIWPPKFGEIVIIDNQEYRVITLRFKKSGVEYFVKVLGRREAPPGVQVISEPSDLGNLIDQQAYFMSYQCSNHSICGGL